MGTTATSTNRIQVYQYDRILGRAISQLESATDVSKSDKIDITRFVGHLQTRGLSKLRIAKYIYHLLVLARTSGKSLRLLRKEDVETLVGSINASNYAEETKHGYKVALKKFYQWLRGCDVEEHEYPEEVRWIKTTLRKKRLLPEALLTIEEVRMLIEATENQRDRALILAHYESGCRIGETLSLRIVHVAFDQYGAVLNVDGKTGSRRVRVIAAAPALASWLSIHPLRNNINAPLWIGVGTVGRHEPLSYSGVRALLRRLAKKTGLNKRVYTHLMRHTRATELANILTEAQMKELLGWVQGSDMPSIYVHLSGRDVDSALLRAHGITPNKEQIMKMELTTKTCPRCKQKAGPETQFCPICGMAMNEKTAFKLEQELSKVDQIMDLLMRDEGVKKFLAERIYQLYASSQLHPPSEATP